MVPIWTEVRIKDVLSTKNGDLFLYILLMLWTWLMEHDKVGLTKTFFFRMGKDMLWMKYSLYSGEWFEVIAQAEIPLDLGLEMQRPLLFTV